MYLEPVKSSGDPHDHETVVDQFQRRGRPDAGTGPRHHGYASLQMVHGASSRWHTRRLQAKHRDWTRINNNNNIDEHDRVEERGKKKNFDKKLVVVVVVVP